MRRTKNVIEYSTCGYLVMSQLVASLVASSKARDYMSLFLGCWYVRARRDEGNRRVGLKHRTTKHLYDGEQHLLHLLAGAASLHLSPPPLQHVLLERPLDFHQDPYILNNPTPIFSTPILCCEASPTAAATLSAPTFQRPQLPPRNTHPFLP